METFASLFTGDDLIDPQYLLNELKDLPAEDCPQGKKWFQGRTYSIHSNLGPDKLNKFKSFVMLLTPEVRIRCMCNAKEKFEQAKRLITSRQEGTNKNDRCRLMHIVHTPEGKVMLSNAFMPKSRQQLDDPSFKEPWQAIANLFNDYQNYKFINLSIKHDVSTGKPFAPYVAQSGYDSIASRAFDLNPQSSDRPVRDAEWCKRVYKELRTGLSKFFSSIQDLVIKMLRMRRQNGANLWIIMILYMLMRGQFLIWKTLIEWERFYLKTIRETPAQSYFNLRSLVFIPAVLQLKIENDRETVPKY
jgi:hypothetical protein